MFVRYTKTLAQSIDLDFSPCLFVDHDSTWLQSDASGGTLEKRVFAGGYTAHVVLLIATDIGLYIDVNYQHSWCLSVFLICHQCHATVGRQYQTG
jgi:hypothetical protein